ncbi:MAG: universal stress protein [Myxococcales bacterium]
MFKRILLPTDFSELGLTARDAAILYARRFEAEVHVLHVDEDISGTVRDPGDLVHYMQTIEVKTDQLLEMLRAELSEAGLPPVVERRPGVPSQVIVKYALEAGCDLIVMATHGRGGFQRLILGSTTLRVLRHTRTPVLAINATATERGLTLPKAILYPTDFSAPSRTALDFALSFADQMGARLDLLHVLKLPTFVPAIPGEPPVYMPQTAVSSMKELYRTELERLTDQTREGSVTYNVTIGGNPGQAIAEYAQEQALDLVVMPSHGHGGLHNLFFGSTAEATVRLSPAPVLVVPPARTE